MASMNSILNIPNKQASDLYFKFSKLTLLPLFIQYEVYNAEVTANIDSLFFINKLDLNET